jgi:glycosyltransferase involved in cell wall biosynthesis
MRFHGWLPRERIDALYAGAHFILLPSRSEGWPKVLSEAMGHGVVPVASAVGSIAAHLATFRAGRAVAERDPRAFADAVAAYVAQPDRWQLESARAALAADSFTYERHLESVRAILSLPGGRGPSRLADARVGEPECDPALRV